MDKDYKRNTKKRGIFLGIIITLVFMSLSLRLYYLQIYKSDELSYEALRQRGKEISLEPKRGIIFDRNLIHLTNNETTPTLIIDRKYLQQDNILYREIIEKTSLSSKELTSLVQTNEQLLKIPLKDNVNLEKSNNFFIVDIINRYSNDNLLSHVIGYINKSDNTGQAGIEKVYDEFLKKDDGNFFIVEFDNSRSLILDGVYYANHDTKPYDPAGVKLAIDYDIQRVIEKTLDEEKLNGSVIVAEIDTGKVLGMASRPNFDQDEIEKYFFSEDMALYNKAIQVGYPPGSIFKIVVLLTALEMEPDILESEYYCNGYEEINGIRINCGSTHGYISIEDGFAKSCNSLFIQISKKIGGSKIMDMARKLGFGSRVNIGLLEEIEGNLPENKDLLGAAIGNIAIGQGKLEVTPLQITNLMLTIANDGIQKPISLVEGITNKEGYVIKDTILDDEISLVSYESAKYMQKLLKYVVTNGTGSSIDLENIGGAGGKTGSAEAILNGKEVIHGWFSGFYPSESPKYIITVLIEDAKNGSRTATPIFEKVAKEIYLINNEK